MLQGFLVALVATLIYMESRIGGQHMHLDPKRVADHPQRVADALLAIERITDGQRMHEVAFRRQRLRGTGGKHPADIGLVDFMAAQIDAGGKAFALQASGGNIDDHRVDGEASHAFGRIDRQADGLFRRVEIDDDA